MSQRESLVQEAPTSLAAAQALANDLLNQWFKDQPVSPEGRAAAARALEGVDWDDASCSCHSQPQALYLRGVLLLLSAAPSPTPAAGPDRRRAAGLMEAAAKLQPSLVDAWNCLGVMHSQAGQLVMALHCLSCGLSAAVTAEGLRQLSLVMRRLAASTGALPHERTEAASASLAAAKQAVALDVKDGFSWYVLGMAHIAAASLAPAAAPSGGQLAGTSRFKQQQQLLQQPGQLCVSAASACPAVGLTADAAAAAASCAARAALAAFAAAERAGLTGLPELWFNRAAVALHLGQLGLALQGFTRAGQLDPSLPAAAQVAGITQLLAALAACTSSSGGGSRRAGLQPQQAAALRAALARDKASHLPEQLLPAGYHLVTWQQHLQQSPIPVAATAAANNSSKGSRSNSKKGHKHSSSGGGGCNNRNDSNGAAHASSQGTATCCCSSSNGNSSSSSSSSSAAGWPGGSRAALHCRIAAVLERLPGCAQWVCVAMSGCGHCFPLLLPGCMGCCLERLLGCCLLLLGPSTSSVTLQAGWGDKEADQALNLVLVHMADAGDVLTPGGASSSSTTSTTSSSKVALSAEGVHDVTLKTMMPMGQA